MSVPDTHFEILPHPGSIKHATLYVSINVSDFHRLVGTALEVLTSIDIEDCTIIQLACIEAYVDLVRNYKNLMMDIESNLDYDEVRLMSLPHEVYFALKAVAVEDWKYLRVNYPQIVRGA